MSESITIIVLNEAAEVQFKEEKFLLHFDI